MTPAAAAILKKVSRFDIVSFDVFDTLLYRPFLEGDDQLLFLELKHGVQGWLDARKEAERQVSLETGTEAPKLADMYRLLPQKWQFMQQEEINFEKDILRPNPEMLEVFQTLRQQGKRLIAVSDMYLGAEILSPLLAACGFDGFEKIFVSCDYGLRKGSGRLFEAVFKELDVDSPRKIIHVGDNLYSDVKMARHAGWKTLPYPKLSRVLLHDRRFRFAQDYWKMRDKQNRRDVCQRSYHLGVLALMYKDGFLQREDIFERFYLCAFPFLLQTMAALTCRAARDKKAADVAFVARDGYLLQQFFDALCNADGSFNSRYVYAPRLLIKMIDLDFTTITNPKKKEDILTVISWYAARHASVSALYKNCPLKIGSFSRVLSIFEQNRELFVKEAAVYRELYREYMASLFPHRRPLLCVDTNTAVFTAQRFLMQFKENVCGCYLSSPDDGPEAVKMTSGALPSHLLLEMFISSPEAPIAGLRREEGNFVPEYRSLGQEKVKAEKIRRFYELNQTFLKRYVFAAVNPEVWSGPDFMNICKYMVSRLTLRESRILSQIKSCGSIAHNPGDYEDIWSDLHDVKVKRLSFLGLTLFKSVKIDGCKTFYFCGLRCFGIKKTKRKKHA